MYKKLTLGQVLKKGDEYRDSGTDKFYPVVPRYFGKRVTKSMLAMGEFRRLSENKIFGFNGLNDDC